MLPFLSIILLTCRSAMRSHVFRILLFFLLLSVVLIPNTIQGDGTAFGYIQVILEYSLGSVTLILAASAVWLSCSEMCNDVESGQLHMIAVKPVSRIIVWLGKLCGVLLIHGMLLLISAVVIYGFVMYQFRHQNFTPEERARTEHEVFTGRRVYLPVRPNMDTAVQEELEKRVHEAQGRGETIPELNGPQRRAYVEDLKRQLIAREGEVKTQEGRYWEYRNLPEDLDAPIFIRYKVFTELSSKNQERSMGAWGYRIMEPLHETGDENSPVVGYNEGIVPMQPEEILTGIFHEFVLPSKVLLHKGTAKIAFVNLAPDGKPLYFQQADGPKLLIRKTGFFMNYMRAVLVTFLGLCALSGIACAASAYLSLPTAVFVTVAYWATSLISTYLVGTFTGESMMVKNFMEALGFYVGKVLLWLLIPVQDFFVADKLAIGELIELSSIGSLILFNLILKGLPFFALGAYLYYRRELGTALKRGV